MVRTLTLIKQLYFQKALIFLLKGLDYCFPQLLIKVTYSRLSGKEDIFEK